MDVEIQCPYCHRLNFLMIPRVRWDKTTYRKCMWCKKGISVQIKVAKIKNIEAFLLKQKETPNISGPGFPKDSKTTKGEGGISVDNAPVD